MPDHNAPNRPDREIRRPQPIQGKPSLRHISFFRKVQFAWNSRIMLNSVVVGSGPAGMAAALALLERGTSVQMVDVGLRLEDERQQVVRRMAETPPDRWDPEDAAFLREGADVDAVGLA